VGKLVTGLVIVVMGVTIFALVGWGGAGARFGAGVRAVAGMLARLGGVSKGAGRVALSLISLTNIGARGRTTSCTAGICKTNHSATPCALKMSQATTLRCRRLSPSFNCGTLALCSGSMKIVIRWFLLASALLLVAHVYPGVVVQSFASAMVAAFVLGLFNTLLRPILVVLTLPVTVLTLGLFLFIINAVMFYFAAELLKGLSVSGFGAALVGSLIYSVLGLVIDVAMEHLFRSPT
jgi:putative membrane protein